MGTRVPELQRRIPYSEFAEWMVFFEMEEQEHKKEHFYFAQICAVIESSVGGKGQIKKYLLRQETPVETAGRENWQKSKRMWMNILKIKPEDN